MFPNRLKVDLKELLRLTFLIAGFTFVILFIQFKDFFDTFNEYTSGKYDFQISNFSINLILTFLLFWQLTHIKSTYVKIILIMLLVAFLAKSIWWFILFGYVEPTRGMYIG
ncbi:MAG: hypothetical protein COW65_18015 [Cytophagales bacterium CG18_big_fil_WC_8_21_14_2_50_42_9]|nr:MAG: hypothetical protein COW65_18015 [Cytophagales bacterium CG18_big_fil_WC_8_21_14_2_50_42_9]